MAEKKYTIIRGDSAQELKNIPDNTIDAVITDPPYGIEFLGKDWDSNTGAVAIWAECHRILKPGGHLLAFSAARTYHHLATNIESVGFEIRDQLMWIYSSGFPKAQDMGKAIDKRGQKNNWHGWKTALKPGHEPIVMARKRFKGSTMANIQRHGVGALNIDATRIPFDQQLADWYRKYPEQKSKEGVYENYSAENRDHKDRPQAGRRTASSSFGDKATQPGGDGSPEFEDNPQGRYPSNVMGEITDYQKYFYCPKVTRRERHCGFDTDNVDSVKSMLEDMKGYFIDNQGNPVDYKDRDGKNQVFLPYLGPIYIHGLKHEFQVWKGKNKNKGNNHPTVKPVALMRYLIELVTPPDSHIVDPFTGSGTTGMAATELGHRFTGIEQDPAYVAIANKRIEGWLSKEQDTAKANTAKHSTANKNTQVTPYDRLFE